MEDKKKDLHPYYGLLSRCRGELMGLAMLWIMAYHAFFWTPAWPWLKDLKEQGFCGVDIFLLLSALGVSMSLSRRQESYWAYLKRRLVRVLPLYLLVSGVYALALRLAGRINLKTAAWTVSTLFYWLGKPHCFNWYIPALVGFYLIAPPAVRLLRRVRWPGMVVAVAWAGCFVLYHICAPTGPVELLGGTVMRLPVFLLGLLLGIFLSRGERLRLWQGAAWLALPWLIPVLQRIVRPYYLPAGFSFCLVCVPLCLAVAWLLERLPGGGLRWLLQKIGESSLEIYLLNVIFVREYALAAPLFSAPEVQYAVTIPINILLGIGLHYLLKKPMSWLTEKVTGSASPSRPPKEEGYSAEDRSGR